MRHAIHRIGILLRVSVVGALVGVVAAFGGLAIEGWNVDHHGAEYSSYRFHDLALGALPGMLITESRYGVDFQLGEVLYHKPDVIGWNALVYASLATMAYFLFRGFAGHSRAQAPTETELPNKPCEATGDNASC